MVRLNVGCGSTTPAEWINIDNSPTLWLARRPLAWRLGRLLRLIPADMEDAPAWARSIVYANALRGLPFDTGSVDAIYASHFLEHLSREGAGRFLKEARRLLRPGGLIRIVVPDLAAIVELYLRARECGDPHAADSLFEDLWVVDKGLERYPSWFRPLKAFLRTDVHRWMYDEASLRALIEEAGFLEVQSRGCLESAIPGLETVESAGRLLDAVCLEARQPIDAVASAHAMTVLADPSR
jgi:predicted SAM-dependent methyltransferase